MLIVETSTHVQTFEKHTKTVLCVSSDDLHKRAWFSIEGLADVSESATGVLAGTPLADLVFVCAFSRVLVRLRIRLQEAGLWDSTDIYQECVFCGLEMGSEPIRQHDAEYVDDLVFPLMSEANMLIAKVQVAFGIVVNVFAAFGFVVNLMPGKSEVMFVLRGPAA